MNKILRKNIAVFLIVLIAAMPFYAASVFAQSYVQDPAQSCLAKKQDSDDVVGTLDSGPIKTLEGIASTLHFTCTAWATLEIGKNTYNTVIGTFDQCNVGTPGTPQYAQCVANSARITADVPFKKIMDPLCSKVECKENFIANTLGLDPISELQTEIGGVGIGPFDNIYTSIAYLCPVGILFNLRKLKAIYQTHSCCIEQACINGLNTESCDRQLSEATCMYWEGSIAQSLVGILIHFISTFFAEALEEKVQELIAEAGIGRYIAAIKALYSAYNHIQKLQEAFQWMSQTFSEPNCDDLNFDKIRDQAEQASKIKCNLIQVDINGDGIIDRLEPRCA
ncbi:hypothetical protein HYU50_01880 [Candidatus Woesearchaeota archaeon]|nr:hypothetical protein [Candidatus Woesearchaeota archaeon]